MRQKTLEEKFWLTQRMTVEDNPKFRLDYMGAAEFEYGAPREAFKRLAILAVRGELVQKDILVEDWKKTPVTVTAIYDRAIEMPDSLSIQESKEVPRFAEPAFAKKGEKPKGFRYQAWVPCENNFNVQENWMDQPGIILLRKEPKVFEALDSLLNFWAGVCVTQKLIKKALPENFSSAAIKEK